MPSTFTFDDREMQKLIAHYEPEKIAKILQSAARAGAKAAEPIIAGAAPTGKSLRPSQFYRREGLSHGAFAATVKARRIRKKGIQAKTIGFVIGPAGRNAFTRPWIALGTKAHEIRIKTKGFGRYKVLHHPGQHANPWIDRVLGPASAAALERSEAILNRWADKVTD